MFIYEYLPDLRSQITERTEQPRASHVKLMERLAKSHPHSIQCVEHAFGAQRRTWDYNCHAFTLGLNKSEEFWDARPECDKGLPESDFMETLIEKGMLEPRSRDEPKDGDILVYYLKSSLKHSGILVDTERARIRSKWGPGHLWEHDIGEVPLNYGEVVIPFNPPNRSTILTLYLEQSAATPGAP